MIGKDVNAKCIKKWAKTAAKEYLLSLWMRRSRMGKTKAAVLPEPVVALAHTSLPCRAIGMA